MGRIEQIKVLLEQIEVVKRKMVEVAHNPKIPYEIKTKKLMGMRENLFIIEHVALEYMEEELRSGTK